VQPAPIAAGAIGTAIAIGKRPASGCKAANGIPDGTVSGEAIATGMLGVAAAVQRRFLRLAGDGSDSSSSSDSWKSTARARARAASLRGGVPPRHSSCLLALLDAEPGLELAIGLLLESAVRTAAYLPLSTVCQINTLCLTDKN